MPRRFGFECELHQPTSPSYIPILRELGLMQNPDNQAHHNHCRCEYCAFTEESDLVRAHTDPSCGGELVTRPLLWPSPDADSVIARVAQALDRNNAVASPRAGFHVHVEYVDLDEAQKQTLVRVFSRYERSVINHLATAGLDTLRRYNQPVWPLTAGVESRKKDYVDRCRAMGMEPNHHSLQAFDAQVGEPVCPSKGFTLALRDATAEFRVWNSVVDEWRMRLAVGTSVALVDAVASGLTLEQCAYRSFTDVLDSHIDNSTLGLIIKQAYHRMDKEAVS